MINPTNKPLEVELGGTKLKLWIDLNTYTAFEARSGQHFMEWIMEMAEAMSESQVSSARATAEYLQKLGIEEMPKDGKFKDPEIQKQVEAIIIHNSILFTKRTSSAKIHAFLWAAAHTYDNPGMDPDDPMWPISYGGIGRLLTSPREINSMMGKIMDATVSNTPKPKLQEMKKQEAENSGDRPTNDQSSTTNNGGSDFGLSDEDVLSLVTPA
jgi:hypothetical protein